jgi:zinc resistance-associated protein
MKMSGKKSLLVVLVVLAGLVLAASVWADPVGMGKGFGRPCGHGGMNLTPEQAAKLFDVKEKFHSDTADLRKQLWVKRAEMAALWKAENPDQNAILAKVKELNALRGQLQEKMVAMRLEIRKIVPKPPMKTSMAEGCGLGPMAMEMDPGFMPPPPPPPMEMDPGFMPPAPPPPVFAPGE